MQREKISQRWFQKNFIEGKAAQIKMDVEVDLQEISTSGRILKPGNIEEIPEVTDKETETEWAKKDRMEALQ